MMGECNPKDRICDVLANGVGEGKWTGGCPLRGHRALAGAACRRAGRARLRRSRPFGLRLLPHMSVFASGVIEAALEEV